MPEFSMEYTRGVKICTTGKKKKNVSDKNYLEARNLKKFKEV